MEWLLLVTFGLAFVVSIFSGMAGGGGGFVMMPYLLFIGLPPANAIATMKLGGTGTNFGSVAAFKGKGLVHKKLVIPFMAITLVCALISAWLIPRLDAAFLQKLIGILLLLVVPTLFIKKAAFQPGARSSRMVAVGFVAYTVFAFIQTLVGTGMGTLVVLTLMFLFGLSALEANATKRVAGTLQALVLIVLLGIQGLVVWTHGVAALLGSLIGSSIGARIAIKKGNQFVKVMMAIVMVVSGVALLV